MYLNRVSIKLNYLFFSIILLSSFFPQNFVNAESEPPALDAYVLSNSWAGESNVLNRPKDIAVGPDGRIYVVNRGLSRITIITPGNEVFGNFGNFGYSDGQLMDPEAIAIDDNGDIYVAGNSFVTKFTANGEFVHRWGYFSGASGIAVDSDGYVYVADTGNNRIRKYTSEGYLVKIGALKAPVMDSSINHGGLQSILLTISMLQICKIIEFKNFPLMEPI